MSASESLVTAAVRFRPLRRTPEDILVEDNGLYGLRMSAVVLVYTVN